jgi:hypothetical protein
MKAIACASVTTALACGAIEGVAPIFTIQVTVVVSGDGDGRVRAPDPQVDIDCSITNGSSAGFCHAEFPDAGGGGAFDLVATADPGHLFNGWEEDCRGTDPRCTLSFSSAEEEHFFVTATFLRIPTAIEVTVASRSLALHQSTTATAAVVMDPPTLRATERIRWTSSDPSVLEVTMETVPGEDATVTALGVGTATITAEARTRVSDPVEVTVTEIPVTYTVTPFATVDVPVEIDFDLQGNLFVGSNAFDSVRIVKVTPDGISSPFGNKVIDPDALIVDKTGVFTEVGAGGVIVAGADDSQYTNNHVTGIKADGSGNVVLIESAPAR